MFLVFREKLNLKRILNKDKGEKERQEPQTRRFIIKGWRNDLWIRTVYIMQPLM